MQQKQKQNSETKRKALLNRSARLRTEAEQLGVEPQLLKTLDKTEENIKSARVEIRKYRDFLKSENTQLDTLQQTLDTIKATNQRNLRESFKASIYKFLLICMPNIAISKLYYLAIIPNPKHIPASSAYVYLAAGDILFWAWFIIAVPYCFAYEYIRVRYITPFTEKYPSLKFSTKFCSISIFLCLYGQFLFYSASLTPKLINPSWGPSLVNVTNLLITILTSSPITAVLALVAILPIISTILKWYKKALSPLLPTWHTKRRISIIPKRISKNKPSIKDGLTKTT